jgi:hypothetical protein
MVTIRGNEITDECLRLACLIDIGRVDKVSSGLRVSIEDLACLLGLGSVTMSRAEHAGPQSDLGHA